MDLTIVGIPQTNDSILQLFMKIYNDNINTQYLNISNRGFNIILNNTNKKKNYFHTTIKNNTELIQIVLSITNDIIKSYKTKINLITFNKNEYIAKFRKLLINELFKYYLKNILPDYKIDNKLKLEIALLIEEPNMEL